MTYSTYFYNREQVYKACQILDNHLRSHASKRLALPYDNICSQTDQEEFKSQLYQHIAEEVLLNDNMDISSYPIKVPTDKLDDSPVKCKVLYPYLEQYIEEQWKLRWKKGIRLYCIPSKDDLQYLEVYFTDKLKLYSRIYRLYDAKLKRSMYCFTSRSFRDPYKDMFREGMGGASDPSWLPPTLSDKLTDGQPYPVEEFMGRGFFAGVSKSECITKEKLENLLESNSLDYRQIVWKHNDLNRIMNLANQVLCLFSNYPIEAFDGELPSTKYKSFLKTQKEFIKVISDKIRQEKCSIEVKNYRYTAEGNPIKDLAPQISKLSDLELASIGKKYLTLLMKNDKETIIFKRGRKPSLPGDFKVNDKEVSLHNWIERHKSSYPDKETENIPSNLETKNIPSDLDRDLDILTNWIEKMNYLNLVPWFFKEDYVHIGEIEYTLEKEKNAYKFSFKYCNMLGTIISVEMDRKPDEKQGNGRVSVQIPGEEAMPERCEWHQLTKFCKHNQSTLTQQGFQTEEIKFQINEAYLQEYERLQNLPFASESDKSSAKESTTRTKKTKKSVER